MKDPGEVATDDTSGAPTPGLTRSLRRAKIVTRVTLTSPWPEGVTNMADARLIVNSRIKAVLTNAGLSTEITEVQ